MSEESKHITVENNEAGRRFEAELNGYMAVAKYRLEPGQIVFYHTEVPEAIEGEGVASILIRTALDTAREKRLEVVPLCPFVAAYIRRHQAYLDLVPPQYRARVLQG